MANSVNQGQDAGDEIPMSKPKPGLLIAVGVGAVLVIGALVFSFSGGKKKSIDPEQGNAAVPLNADGKPMSAEERKKHLEMTRRSLQRWEEEKKAEDAKKAAAKQSEEEKKQASAAPVGGGGPAPAGGGAPKPVNKKATKKQADALDNMGKDILSGMQ